MSRPIADFDIHSFDRLRFGYLPFELNYAFAAIIGVAVWVAGLGVWGAVNTYLILQQYGAVVATITYLTIPFFAAMISAISFVEAKRGELTYARSLKYINTPVFIEEDELIQSVPWVSKGFRDLPDKWVETLTDARGLHAWVEYLDIPQGKRPIIDHNRVIEQPCEMGIFVSGGRREENLHFHPGLGTGYKGWAIGGASVAVIGVVLFRSRRPYIHGKPIPIFQICLSPWVAKQVQAGAEIRYLTKTELETLEVTVIEDVAHAQELRAETAEARLRRYESVQFDIGQKAEREKSRMEEWESDAMDTTQPINWGWVVRHKRIVGFLIFAGALAVIIGVIVR